MLNFIVMGEIPGTNIQITFFGLLILVGIPSLTIGIYHLLPIVVKRIKDQEDDQKLISV